MKIKQLTTLKHKLQWLILLTALLGVSQGGYASFYYAGEDNSWGADAMTVSTDGFYEYKQVTEKNKQFKIRASKDNWDTSYGKGYVSAGFNSTNVTNIGGWGDNDNCYRWYDGTCYILFYYANTDINSTNNPIICASTTLPDDTPSCTTPTSVSASPASANPKLDAATISQTLTATPSGGTGTPDYEWSITSNPNSGASITSGGATATPTVSFTRTGTYVFNVKAGCDIENSDYVQNTCTVTVSKSTDSYYINYSWNGEGWSWQQMTADDNICEWTYVGKYNTASEFNINTDNTHSGYESPWYTGVSTTGNPSKGDLCIFKFTPTTSGSAESGTVSITKLTTYTITGAVDGGTGGSISPTSVQKASGETVTFTAKPSSGYSVVKWNDGSDHVTTATTFDYTVGTSAQTVTVYFQCNAPSVTPGYETSTAQTICVGETALSLSVTESGYVSSRKWQRKGTGQGDDWTDISNSSSTTYNVPNNDASSYYYHYVATGCTTTTTASSSLYTVNALPESVSINEVTACSGVGFNLTLSRVLAQGESAAWYKKVNGNWTSLASATGVVQSAETDYKVIITNSNGCTVEATRTVGMITPNALTGISLDVSYICNGVTTTVRPSDLYLSEGATLYYSSSATGTATVSKNQDNTATVTGGSTTGSATITASISGGCGSVASQTATVNVVAAPTVLELTNPSGQYTMCSDGSITLKIASTQSDYTYQLYQNGVTFGSPVSGGGDKTFDVDQSGIYTAKAYYGSSESSCLTNMDGSITLNISTTPILVRSTPEVTNYGPVTITSINSDIYKWQVKDKDDNVVCDTDPDNLVPGTTAYLYDQTATSVTFKGASSGSVYEITATTKAGCPSEPAEIEVNNDTPCN